MCVMKIDGKESYQEQYLDGEFEGKINQSPSIKITKNSKGYNFEFKILSLNTEELDEIHNKIVASIKKWEQQN